MIKEIENRSQRRIKFRLSLDHFTEGRNDEYRARGVFKKVLNALITLEKYEFATEIVCVNLKNENSEILKEGFLNLFKRNNINIETKKIKYAELPVLNLESQHWPTKILRFLKRKFSARR